MKIPKSVREDIKSSKLKIKKMDVGFPKEKQHKIAKDTSESMKKHFRMKHSKEDLSKAHAHMKKHGG